jgi:hypothetical protein
VLRTYKKAQEMGEKDAIDGMERAFIGMADKFAEIVDKKTKKYVEMKDRTVGGLTREDRVKFNNYSEKIMAGITSSDDIKDLQKDWWKNSEALDAADKFWGGNQIGEAARVFGRGFMDQFQADVSNKGANYFAVRNPKVLTYLSSSAAQGLGFSALEGASSKEEIKIKVDYAKEVSDMPYNQLSDRIKGLEDGEKKAVYNEVLRIKEEGLPKGGQTPIIPDVKQQPRRRGWKQRGT